MCLFEKLMKNINKCHIMFYKKTTSVQILCNCKNKTKSMHWVNSVAKHALINVQSFFMFLNHGFLLIMDPVTTSKDNGASMAETEAVVGHNKRSNLCYSTRKRTR